jgi:quercetin dioxygenase-like cupin family protein
MWKYTTTLATIILLMSLGSLPTAQAPARSPAAPRAEADPGVTPNRLIDRAEVRVTRVELQPGSTRRVHTHDDVQFHLWMPLSGTMQLSIGGEAPVAAATGQPVFFKRGTPHGFKNVGATPAAVLEIFVKDTPGAAARQNPFGALQLGLAALQNARER